MYLPKLPTLKTITIEYTVFCLLFCFVGIFRSLGTECFEWGCTEVEKCRNFLCSFSGIDNGFVWLLPTSQIILSRSMYLICIYNMVSCYILAHLWWHSRNTVSNMVKYSQVKSGGWACWSLYILVCLLFKKINAVWHPDGISVFCIASLL